MSATLNVVSLPTELAYRETDGIAVSLWWNRDDDACTVTVSDLRSGESFDVPVLDGRALDVFYHPFAYAAARGVEHRIGDQRPDDADNDDGGGGGRLQAA